MMGQTSQGRLGRLPTNACPIDIPSESILWFPAVVLRETVVVREYAQPNAEGSRCLMLGEMQKRHACCLSPGEIPYYVDQEIPSIFPLLFGGILFYLPDTISPMCLQNLLMSSRKLKQESLRCSKGISQGTAMELLLRPV
jgi:hypothetical protein